MHSSLVDPLLWYDHPQPEIQTITAVTSLSQRPVHLERQRECLATWRLFGLQIHAVNFPEEIDFLREHYGDLIEAWHPCYASNPQYSRKTPLIRDIAAVSRTLHQTILVMNSDIELHGPQQDLLQGIENPRTQLVGIRQNYTNHWTDATQEYWGLDAFSFTPARVALLPEDLPYAIGFPMWDYAVPWFTQRNHGALALLGDGIFYHKKHDLLWSQEDWAYGVEWMNRYCSLSQLGFIGWAHWRRSLPFPPPPEPTCD